MTAVGVPSCSNAPICCSKSKSIRRRINRFDSHIQLSRFQASQSIEDKNRVYKELGLFSLRKRIEDAVLRAETMAPTALEIEEAKRVKQVELTHEHNLWEDLAKSNEILDKLAVSAKVVDALKDLTFKAEEAKLITQLAEMDYINYGLFKQAYNASVDVCKFLDHYEMSKLLMGPYDLEGACMVIRAGSEGLYSEIWAEQLISMYMKWAKKQGHKGRVVEKQTSSKNGGIESTTLEFEFERAYGHLSGEKGVHHMIRNSENGSVLHEVSLACVDVIPLFLGRNSDVQINDDELVISSESPHPKEKTRAQPAVCIRHIPSGVWVQSSGERNHFSNKIKALNRLKAKLSVIAREQGVDDLKDIDKDAITDPWSRETRRYVFHPYKLVLDVKTGIQLPDLNSVLDGNLEPIIGAHINLRQANDVP